LLPEIFPAVPHIRRFNLTSEAARRLLVDADAHLGAVPVPYALSVHEAFVMDCLAWLHRLRLRGPIPGRELKAWNMYALKLLFNRVGL
jgi:hypothetical protein